MEKKRSALASLMLATVLASSPAANLTAAGFGVGRSGAVQGSVTSADIQRIEDDIYQASREIVQARSRDSALASTLQSELDNARDEAAYLKVKLRRNEPIARSEYSDLRDRIDNIRSRARGDSPSARGGRTVTANEVPVGTEFDVRLQKSLSSGTAQVEDRFDATTMVDLRAERDGGIPAQQDRGVGAPGVVNDGSRVVVPAGSVMRGVVSSVTKATRTERTGKLTVVFDRITIKGRSYPIRATVEQALESEGIRGEAGRIGVGAGAGAILGAILGGAKGALAGILIGGGGTIAATEGKDVELPAGTVLRVRLDSGLSLQP